MKRQCTPDRNCETRAHDCEHFRFICWRILASDGKDSALGYCDKLGKNVQYYYFEEPPCEPRQTTLM